jgi:hypothetical protein
MRDKLTYIGLQDMVVRQNYGVCTLPSGILRTILMNVIALCYIDVLAFLLTKINIRGVLRVQQLRMLKAEGMIVKLEISLNSLLDAFGPSFDNLDE